jgi:hypothetical protein
LLTKRKKLEVFSIVSETIEIVTQKSKYAFCLTPSPLRGGLGWGVDVTSGFQNPPLSLTLSSRRGDKAKNPLHKERESCN